MAISIGVALVTALLLVAAPATATEPEGSGHQRMLAILAKIAEGDPEGPLTLFPQREARRLSLELERYQELERDGNPAFDPLELWELLFDLGQAEVKVGNVQAGISHLLRARDVLDGLDPGVRKRLDSQPIETIFHLAVAYMRLGEDQNCCMLDTAEACILPLRGKGMHSKEEGSRNAIKYFKEVLAMRLPAKGSRTEGRDMNAPGLSYPSGPSTSSDPSTSDAVRYHMTARWLLNIAHMTLGGYPDNVPDQYLIDPKAFKSAIDFPRFENVAPKLGLDTFNLSGGVIVDDFDGDDHLDIVTSTMELKGQTRFFRNNADGTFTDRTEQAGLLGFYGGLNMVQADYDNDGDTDILVLRGAWLGQWGRHPNSLLRNNGDGTFIDMTFEAGLGDENYPKKTAAWGDYDLDGDLDLFIANETSGDLRAPTQLFRNNGDGKFTNVAPESGAQGHCFGMATVWGDYDNDRYPDLYVGGCTAPALLRNSGDGTFANAAAEAGITPPKRSFTSWFWDFDNDGHLDLFVGSSDGSAGVVALNPLGTEIPASDPELRSLQESVEVDLMHLFRNDGHGKFREVGRQQKLTYPAAPMGGNFGDLDNDGYPDFYLSTGNVAFWELVPNLMFLNQGGEGFVNVTMAGGFGHLQKGHGVSFADIDNDGDQDVYVQMGGAYPGDRFSDALFENPGFGNHWITVKLEGRRSNRSAIGARIHARILEGGNERSVYKHVNSGGSFGCNPLRQTIGLGKADRLVRLEIFWPVTELTQVLENVPMDQIIRIVEGESGYTPIRLHGYKLGGDRPPTASPR